MKIILNILLVTFASFLFISCEKEVSTSPHGDEERFNGKVYINSEPAGATIYLNGKISGKKTPDSLVWLADQEHYVTLRKFLYRDTTISVKVSDGNTTGIDVKYLENPNMYGSIHAKSNPENADILIDGEPTNLKSPAVISGLIPGTYEISFKYANHRDGKQSAIVRSKNITTIESTLPDTTDWVSFKVTNSGIPENDLTSIAVDDNNIVWVGTATKGIARFDGTNWEYITTENSNLPSNEVTVIEKDKDGYIWMGTMAGAAVYRNGSWQLYTVDNSELHDDRISCIEFDSKNNVWFGTQGGIAVERDTGWAIYTKDNSGLAGNFINEINTNVGGEIWAGTSKDGLSRYFGYWKPITNFNWQAMNGTVPGSTVSAFAAEEESGLAWIGWLPERNGGAGGLTTFDGTTWISGYRGLPSSYITCVFIDNNNVKWIGTDSGLFRFKTFNSNRTYKTVNSGLEADYIVDVAKGSNGFVWIATKGGGLTKYKKEDI